MKMRNCLVAIVAAVLVAPCGYAAPHTPKRGSAERTAICDGLRAYVIRNLAEEKLPRPILFVIDHLRVDGDFAWFEGHPVFEDGSNVPTGYLPDFDYCMILERSGGVWVVRADLSRNDVPSPGEVAEIRRSLPRGMPTSIAPEFWSRLLFP